MSPFVRRFSDAGTHDTSHALRRPASEKRQGTKSRWGIVGGAATMGISPREVRIRHEMFEMVMARVSAIACGYEDANDLDRLRHDPLMKLAVGRCPQSGGALASQSTICRLENAPRKTEAARLCAALIDQFGTTVRPGKLEILDIDDTFCAAHGGQQLAFWNAGGATAITVASRRWNGRKATAPTTFSA